jgi:3-methyl-2-oxobutanoate hydroxymethyltransferase
MDEQTQDEQPQKESSNSPRTERITVPDLRGRKSAGAKIVMVTAYDYPAARLADRAGVDVVLVGDSLGTVVLGHKTVVPVTLEDILYHVRAVRRGLKRALLLADMPFGSYQVSTEEAIRNAILLIKAGAQAVKLEGGAPVFATIRRMTDAGIPVMGHLGLTPQSVHMLGGHRAQGHEPEMAERIRQDAQGLEAAGVFGIVLETIPAALATQITADVSILTVGIGAGPGCDGQVQVWHDLLGLTTGRSLRHVKRYASLGETAEAALRDYAEEVRQGRFPTKEHSL